jgi:hypothetical protein
MPRRSPCSGPRKGRQWKGRQQTERNNARTPNGTRTANPRKTHARRPPHCGQESAPDVRFGRKSSSKVCCPHESSAARPMSPTRHRVSWSKRGLWVSSWLAASMMFASFDANAFVCLPSAEAVKQQDAAAWPSWTLRAPGFEGKKCWYGSTRAASHDHQKLPAPVPAAPSPPAVVISEPRAPEPEVTGSATQFERARPAAPNRTAVPNLDSTFEDRFLAVCPTAERSVPGCGPQPQIIGRRSDRSKSF